MVCCREICGFHKHGGIAVSAQQALAASALAEKTAAVLHKLLTDALTELEARTLEQRMAAINRRRQQFHGGEQQRADGMEVVDDSSTVIRADDPMLSFQSLHQSVNMPATAV
jgi:ABC-type lipoprotein export system ATPase subunit